MTPSAIQYRPHDNCHEVSAFLGVEDDCDGFGVSDAPLPLTLGTQPLELLPGEVVIVNPDARVVRHGSSTLLVLSADTAQVVKEAAT